jgi:phosphohistidine phosphatase
VATERRTGAFICTSNDGRDDRNDDRHYHSGDATERTTAPTTAEEGPMRVCLVRHGIAEERSPDKTDADRALTREGVRKTRKAARGLKGIGLTPTMVLTSPLARARQTAAIVAERFSIPPERMHQTAALEPDAGPGALLKELATLEAEEVVCVGHAPHLDGFVAAALGLDGEVTEVGKSGAACLEFLQFEPPAATLRWLARPRMLRRLGA